MSDVPVGTLTDCPNPQTYFPSTPPKDVDALRLGILGAAAIAPSALINPARSHPGVKIEVRIIPVNIAQRCILTFMVRV